MNLNFWFWELEFWTLPVLWRSGSDGWFPSPKQINRIQNQNLHKKSSGTGFDRTSWFLVKVYIKANSCRIKLFEQFWILKWRNGPQNQNVREKPSKASPFWKFWLLVKIYAKVNFIEIGAFVQFLSLRWRNGSQNQNVLKKPSGTDPFWKFWLFGQSQRSKLVRTPFFPLFFLIFFYWASDSDLGQKTGRV